MQQLDLEKRWRIWSLALVDFLLALNVLGGITKVWNSHTLVN